MSGCHNPKELSDCIDEMKERMASHNKWAERYVDEFEEKLKVLEGMIQTVGANASSRIDQMTDINFTNVWHHFNVMKDRLDKIEELSKYNMFPEAKEIFKTPGRESSKPYRCPVCDSKPIQELRIVKTESGNDRLLIECHGCEGKGIVWC